MSDCCGQLKSDECSSVVVLEGVAGEEGGNAQACCVVGQSKSDREFCFPKRRRKRDMELLDESREGRMRACVEGICFNLDVERKAS